MLRSVWLRCRLSRIPAQRRLYSTAVAQDVSKLRNMAFVAHIGQFCGRTAHRPKLTVYLDSGKTTLTESVLYTTSYLSCSGSVDTGSTTTDFLPVERERGITVQSASIPVKWKDWTLNLIDTPGHADFGMEVESASRVIDGAVVLLDSVEGVEAQTKGVWQQLDRWVRGELSSELGSNDVDSMSVQVRRKDADDVLQQVGPTRCLDNAVSSISSGEPFSSKTYYPDTAHRIVRPPTICSRRTWN